LKKEGEQVEEGREQLLKDRNSAIIFRVLLMKIKEHCGVMESVLDWKSVGMFFFISALLLCDPG
jgi:hypothetical protein